MVQSSESEACNWEQTSQLRDRANTRPSRRPPDNVGQDLMEKKQISPLCKSTEGNEYCFIHHLQKMKPSYQG